MTRKDYVLLAAAIVGAQEWIKSLITTGHGEKLNQLAQLRGVRRAAAHICDALAEDNPRFDPGQFLTACGYGTTTTNPRDPALIYARRHGLMTLPDGDPTEDEHRR